MTGRNGLGAKALAMLLIIMLTCGFLTACQTAETSGKEGSVATDDEPLRQTAADMINAAFGTTLTSKELFLRDDPDPDNMVGFGAGQRDDEMEIYEYSVYLERETGKLVSVWKDPGRQVKGFEDAPVLEDIDAEQDKQQVADMALITIEALTGAKPKAYFIDAVQLMFDADDSIATDCHILLDNGDYYIVRVVYPGYRVSGCSRETEYPFGDLEQLPESSFEVWGIF